jgi:mycofactocin precursor
VLNSERRETMEDIRNIPEQAKTESEEAPEVLEEICVEELAIDGICGVY